MAQTTVAGLRNFTSDNHHDSHHVAPGVGAVLLPLGRDGLGGDQVPVGRRPERELVGGDGLGADGVLGPVRRGAIPVPLGGGKTAK